MRKQLYLIPIISWVLGLLSACSPSVDRVDGLLEQADKYMEIHPDSALLLLQEIPQPEKLQGRQRADYALLLTQARDKNYLDSLQSDSLMKIAVDYYKDGTDKVKAGKAFFYYGRLLHDNDTLAIKYYQKAQTMFEGTDEDMFLGLLMEYTGYLNFKQKMYGTAIENFKKSITYYEQINHKSGIVHACRNIARGYYYKMNNDSACWYTNRGLALIRDDNDSVKSDLLQMLGLVYFREKRYNEAVTSFKQAIEYSQQVSDLYGYHISLGRTYLDMGKLIDAERCFKLCLEYACNYPFSLAGAYNYLCLLKKKEKNYFEALAYKEKSDSLLEIVHNESIQKQLLFLQEQFNSEKIKMENAQIRLEKDKQTYFYLFILLVVLILSLWLIYYFYKRYQERHQSDLQAIQKNEQIITDYALRIGELEQKGEIGHKEIGLLNQKILLLGIENKKLRKNVNLDALFLINQLREGSILVEKLSSDEWQHIFDYLDLVFGSFFSRLKEHYQLTKTDLILAALLKLGFSNEQLILVFDCLANSLFKMKQRLKHRLNIEKGESLEEFIMKY